MRVLDLDLDFFVSPTPVGWDTEPGERLDGERFRVWAPDAVTQFLEEGLGLSTTARVPARVASTHDVAFETWKASVAAGQLIAPFDVVHVDNHADLGMGDAGWHYLTTELLHQDPSTWTDPRRGAVEEGNYLTFAIAAGWVRSVLYVAPPCRFAEDGQYRREDRIAAYFREGDPDSGVLALPVYARGAAAMGRLKPERHLPAIPFVTRHAGEVRITEPFDAAFVAQSPRYTPATADALLPVIERYLAL